MYALVVILLTASSGSMTSTTVHGFTSEKVCKEAAVTIMSNAKANEARAVCVKVK